MIPNDVLQLPIGQISFGLKVIFAGTKDMHWPKQCYSRISVDTLNYDSVLVDRSDSPLTFLMMPNDFKIVLHTNSMWYFRLII